MLFVMIPQALFSKGTLINSLFLQQGKKMCYSMLFFTYQHHLIGDGEASWEEDSVLVRAKTQQAA